MNHHDKIHLIKRSVILLLSLCLLAFSILPFTLAWFHVGVMPYSFGGEVMWGYFARGDGSAENPFIINKPIHLYNFAWLQYQGVLNDLAVGSTPHVQIDPALSGSGLDMAGSWDANEWISGAIPPIGTTKSPFTGVFNGNGVIIKNLWVSTDPNDWKERPANLNTSTIGTDVGLFGYVDKTAKIGNFYLQNIEVTNTINTAGVNLGILAGYVDGEIQNVGIKNAKLSFHSGKPAQATSDFALIGKITTSVFWEEQPGGGHYNDPIYAGGDLQINPSASGFSLGTADDDNNPQKQKVKDGVDAY